VEVEFTLIVLTIEELAELGILSRNTDNFTFQGQEFRVGPTFSLKMRSAAVSFGEQQEQQGCECLLIERTNAITVWTAVAKSIEKPIEQPVKKKKSTFNREAFIACCRQELTKSIGPMAGLIIEELANCQEQLEPRQAIEWIVTQIPDSRLAAEFKQNIKQAKY
jgi:hypothetical protein